MGYDKGVLRNVLLRLKDLGVDGVLIGSTVLLLHLGVDEFEDDVDVFVTNFSPYADEDLVRSISAKLGCELSQNEWGTPALYCIFNNNEVIIELHENVLDLYIPENIIKSAKEAKLMDIRVRCISIEDYVALKARAGRDHDLEDLSVVADLVKVGKLKLDINFIKERIRNEFPEEEKLLLSRLRNAGLKV
ncbi:MAG: nucleotidyltransferase [Sulfolobales archaeon]